MPLPSPSFFPAAYEAKRPEKHLTFMENLPFLHETSDTLRRRVQAGMLQWGTGNFEKISENVMHEILNI